MRRYLIVVEGDVEPRLEGPYDDDTQRLGAALRHREQDEEWKDGMYRLDIDWDGNPTIDSFAGFELES